MVYISFKIHKGFFFFSLLQFVGLILYFNLQLCNIIIIATTPLNYISITSLNSCDLLYLTINNRKPLRVWINIIIVINYRLIAVSLSMKFAVVIYAFSFREKQITYHIYRLPNILYYVILWHGCTIIFLKYFTVKTLSLIHI